MIYENELQQLEFELLWLVLELEEQQRAEEWQIIMDEFEYLEMLDYDEESFILMQETLAEASVAFSERLYQTQILIDNTLDSFFHNYRRANENINQFFNRFWAAHREMELKLEGFHEAFAVQNEIVQNSLYEMHKYVAGRIATMGIGSGYGANVVEYVPLITEGISAAPTEESGSRVMVYIVVITGILIIVAGIISKHVIGRIHQ